MLGVFMALALAGQTDVVVFNSDDGAFFRYDCESFSSSVSVRGTLDARAIQGEASLLLREEDFLGVSLTAPARRRLQLVFWVLPTGALPSVSVFSSGVDAFGSGQTGVTLMQATPTGRVRSDGWVELELVHETPAVEDVQFNISIFAPLGVDIGGQPASAAVDALRVLDAGPVVADPRLGSPCRLITEEHDCGEQLLCRARQCVQPGVVDSPRQRQALVARRAFEVRQMSGPVTAARDVDAVAEAIVALADDDSAHFRARLDRAVANFRDGHPSSIAEFGGDGFNARACLEAARVSIDGEEAVRPMVWSVASGEQAVAPADVVMAIDGVPPYEWLSRAHRILFAPVRPEALAAYGTRALWSAAAQAMASVRLSRCLDDNCLSRIEFEVDAGQGVFDFEEQCVRMVPDTGPISFYDRGDIRIVNVHSYPFDGQDFFRVLDEVVTLPLADGGTPRGVVLDQRDGTGGFTSTAGPLAATFLSLQEQPRFIVVERAENDAIDVILAACTTPEPCPRAFVPSGVHHGAFGDAPLALLVGNSTSNSEVTTELLRLRRAPVRVFGHGPTSGGFGFVAPWDALDGRYSGTHQAYDGAFARAGDIVTHRDLRSTLGTVPDEEVLPDRDDVLAGRDPVVEAALRWLAGELGETP